MTAKLHWRTLSEMSSEDTVLHCISSQEARKDQKWFLTSFFICVIINARWQLLALASVIRACLSQCALLRPWSHHVLCRMTAWQIAGWSCCKKQRPLHPSCWRSSWAVMSHEHQLSNRIQEQVETRQGCFHAVLRANFFLIVIPSKQRRLHRQGHAPQTHFSNCEAGGVL